MSSRPELKLDWCSHKAAKYAVEHWHYSRRMPAGKNIFIGVWEDAAFIGTVVFGKGVCNHLVGSYGLGPMEGCELVRVALRNHASNVSRIVSIAIRLLRRQSPGIRLIVSFADETQNHHGGIYQAGNWIYTGKTAFKQEYIYKGRRVPDRVVSQAVKERRIKRQDLQKVLTLRKHRYLYPLDSAMRAQIEPLRKPYPKRAGSVASDTSADQAEKGGATPTPALSNVSA
jgi:hypothetical protein